MPVSRCAVWKHYSWKLAVLALTMSILITGLVVLIFHLTGANNRKNNFQYSMAEPVKQNSTGSKVYFPFGREVNRPWPGSNTMETSTPSRDLFKCPKGYFPCNSTMSCLEVDRRCDGLVDCLNAEDELNCVCAFRMPPVKFCDKYPDCFDQSDESFCNYCPPESFNCGNGRCIPRSKVCDTQVDCENAMDENFCFRLSSDAAFASVEGSRSSDSNASTLSKTGFLLKNQKGVWYPVCANPYDAMQDALASHACVSITANPLAASTHHHRKFITNRAHYDGDFIYHYLGGFVQWSGCLTDQGIFVTCDDVLCGFNPRLLLPRPRQGRIVGGELSVPGAWPWHAAIYKNGTYACGATLINNYWLLSAAHCFLNYRNNYYEVQLGMLRRRSFTPHQKTYRIHQIIPHFKFNIVTLEYDIVLLKTSEPVAFDFWVRPICLPDPRRTESSGSFCTAIGWGDTGEKEDDSDDLQEVHVPLTKSCRKSDRWLCAGFPEGGRDACQGDSGGPLMCLQEDRLSWYIAGVISAGTGCARPKSPGMYTRVAFFIDWIKTVMTAGITGETPLSSCPGWRCSAVGGGNCLAPNKVCDGHVDCYDAQDEVNCVGRKKTSKRALLYLKKNS